MPRNRNPMTALVKDEGISDRGTPDILATIARDRWHDEVFPDNPNAGERLGALGAESRGGLRLVCAAEEHSPHRVTLRVQRKNGSSGIDVGPAVKVGTPADLLVQVITVCEFVMRFPVAGDRVRFLARLMDVPAQLRKLADRLEQE